jgi:hypothetical protein
MSIILLAPSHLWDFQILPLQIMEIKFAIVSCIVPTSIESQIFISEG